MRKQSDLSKEALFYQFKSLRLKQEQKRFEKYKFDKLESARFSDKIMQKIKADLERYKPKKTDRSRNGEMVYLRILEKTQKFLEKNFELFLSNRTKKTEIEMEGRLDKLLAYIRKLHEKKKLTYLNSEVTRLFALQKRASNWEDLEQTQKILKNLKRNKLMTAAEQTMLEVCRAKREIYRRISDEPKLNSVKTMHQTKCNTRVATPISGSQRKRFFVSERQFEKILNSNFQSKKRIQADQVYKEQYGMLQNQSEEEMRDECIYSESTIQYETMKDQIVIDKSKRAKRDNFRYLSDDTKTLFETCKALEFNVNYLVKESALNMKQKEKQFIKDISKFQKIIENAETKLKTKMGKSSEKNREFDILQNKQAKQADFFSKSEKLVENSVKKIKIKKKLMSYYKKRNEVIKQLIGHFESIKQAQLNMKTKIQNRLKDMEHQYNVASFLRQLEIENMKATREGRETDVMVPTFKAHFDREVHLSPTIRVGKRRLTSLEIRRFAVTRSTSHISKFWNHFRGNMVVGAAMAIALICEGSIWGSISSGCLARGLRAFDSTGTGSRDPNAFCSDFCEILETIRQEKGDLSEMVSEFCKEKFGQVPNFSYNLSIYAIKMIFRENTFDKAIQSFQEEIDEKRLNLRAAKLNERRIQKWAKNLPKKILKNTKMMQQINGEVFEAKRLDFKRAAIENPFVLNAIYNWTEDVIRSKCDEKELDCKYRKQLKAFYGCKEQVMTSLRIVEPKVHLYEENREYYVQNAQELAQKQIEAIRNKNAKFDFDSHFADFISNFIDQFTTQMEEKYADSQMSQEEGDGHSESVPLSVHTQNDDISESNAHLAQSANKIEFTKIFLQILNKEDDSIDLSKKLKSSENKYGVEIEGSQNREKIKNEFRKYCISNVSKSVEKKSDFYKAFQSKMEKFSSDSSQAFKLKLLHDQFKYCY